MLITSSVFDRINRFSLNCILSRGGGISAIYKLCTFQTLEQYFLTNDLGFLYDNAFRDKHGRVSTTSAVVSQQSLLKYFVDKLLSPLREELIVGFCVDDFQLTPQKKGHLVKLSEELIVDVFNSFENAYDLFQLCGYRAAKKMLSYEFGHLADVSKDIVANPIGRQQSHLGNNVCHDNDDGGGIKESLRKMEGYRIKRQNKLSHIVDFTKAQESLLFYDSRQLQLQDSGVCVFGYVFHQ